MRIKVKEELTAYTDGKTIPLTKGFNLTLSLEAPDGKYFPVKIKGYEINNNGCYVTRKYRNRKLKKITKEMLGKDFDCPQYKKLQRRLDAHSVFFIKSIDRLGRNYADFSMSSVHN